MVDNRMSPEFPSDFNLTQIEATVDWLEFEEHWLTRQAAGWGCGS